MPRDAHCSYCGARYPEPPQHPRTCAACGMQTWANPLPVGVVLLPVSDGGRTGLLVIRRAIAPAGKLALVGGYIEEHEPWQVGAARELREEANVEVDPQALEPFWFASSRPNPNRLVLFALAPSVSAAALPAFTASAECSERGVIFGVDGLAGALAFDLHEEAARRYLVRHGAGPFAFVAA